MRVVLLVLGLVMAPTVAFFLWAWAVKIKQERKIAGTLVSWVIRSSTITGQSIASYASFGLISPSSTTMTAAPKKATSAETQPSAFARSFGAVASATYA